jgi:hypothetical protein
MSDAPRPSVRVTVSGGADTELFVIDHALQLAARGPLPWSGALAPGLYKFKFRRGTAIQEQTVVIDPRDGTYAITAPALTTTSPVPVAESGQPPDAHMEAAYRHSRQTDRTVGSGGELFILVRDARPDGSPRTEPPAAGLAIADTAGNVLVDLDAEAERGGAEQGDGWAAMNVAVAPGAYVLRLETASHGPLSQSIVVSAGWQTQVFLFLANHGSASQPEWRADLSGASVLMARRGRGFTPSDEEFRMTDTALAWLKARQQSTAGEAIKRALDAKSFNPMLGLYAAHAVIGSRSRDDLAASASFDPALLGRMADTLAGLLPGHPDVIALQLWLGRPGSVSIAAPPMLASSWEMIVTASASRPALIPRGSLASRIGGSLWGGGPWLIWLADTAVHGTARRDVDVSKQVRSVIKRIGDVHRIEAIVPELTDVQRALIRAARQVRSPRELVEATGVPLATLQNAAVSLVKKAIGVRGRKKR